MLVFSVTPFKIDQIKIQNRSTVQNLRSERGGKYAKTLEKIQVRGIFRFVYEIFEEMFYTNL